MVCLIFVVDVKVDVSKMNQSVLVIAGLGNASFMYPLPSFMTTKFITGA